MRPSEFTDDDIICAGQELRSAGRNITGFALRQKVGGGNPNRLKQVWDEHLASQSVTKAEPVAELPVEVAEEVATVTAALTERITKLATALNDKAVRAAERRVGEVVRAAGEQCEQAECELVDASQTVEELEDQLATAKSVIGDLDKRLADGITIQQSQAVELAQVRERLVLTDQTAAKATSDHAAEMKRLSDAMQGQAQQFRDELDGLKSTLEKTGAERDQLRADLATLKASADSDVRQAREEANLRRIEADQSKLAMVAAREEIERARAQGSEAREGAAKLRGQVDALHDQVRELMGALSNRLAEGDVTPASPSAKKKSCESQS